MQIYTENWVNSPGQEEDNIWQAFVFVPKDNWYIAKASSVYLIMSCLVFWYLDVTLSYIAISYLLAYQNPPASIQIKEKENSI